MPNDRIGKVEGLFADLVWDNEPLSSGDLVKLCREKLGWAKSTTYTVLKRLCEKGLFCNENGLVFAQMTKEEWNTVKSQGFVKENFNGSLPAFVAAFTAKQQLSTEEIKELRSMIDSWQEK